MPLEPKVVQALADIRAASNAAILDRQRSKEELKNLIEVRKNFILKNISLFRQIWQATEKAKAVQRKAMVKATKAEHKNAGSKRAVSGQFQPLFSSKCYTKISKIGHLMNSGNFLDDVDFAWDKLARAAETDGHEVATVDNLIEVNTAILKQSK